MKAYPSYIVDGTHHEHLKDAIGEAGLHSMAEDEPVTIFVVRSERDRRRRPHIVVTIADAGSHEVSKQDSEPACAGN